MLMFTARNGETNKSKTLCISHHKSCSFIERGNCCSGVSGNTRLAFTDRVNLKITSSANDSFIVSLRSIVVHKTFFDKSITLLKKRGK